MSDKQNPADVDANAVPKDFMPMSAATLKLQVGKKPGWHRHWFRDDPGRIARAQRAGYRFVDPNDVTLNNFDLGGDAKDSGNTDLGGSRVSVISGDAPNPATGQYGKLYLMECPEHLYQLSMKEIEKQNRATANAITAGMVGTENMNPEDRKNLKIDAKVPDFFNPNKTRRPG